MKNKLRILAIVIALCLSLGAFPVFAADGDVSSGSLTITKAIAGSSISLYQIQTKNADHTFTTTADFAKYPIDLAMETPEDMRAVATTLTGYIVADQPKAYAEAEVAEDGTAVFSELPSGLYLAIAGDGVIDGQKYEQAPVLAFLPATEEDGTVIYDLTAEIKKTPIEEKESYSVIKIWKDNDSKARPESIQVQLYQDGEAYGSPVTLSAENDWKYTWEDLDAESKYTVKEVAVPGGYTVKITEESGTYILTNTKDSEKPTVTPTPTPSVTASPTPSPSVTTSPTPTPSGNRTNRTPSNRLPQTGQLWWPIPILLIVGIGFIVIGFARRRNDR